MKKITMWLNLKGTVNSDLAGLYTILGKKAFHQYVKACMRYTCEGRMGTIPVFSNFLIEENIEAPMRIMISFTDESVVEKLERIPEKQIPVYVKSSVRACMGTATIYSILAHEELSIVDLKALTKKIKAKKKKPLTPAQKIKRGIKTEPINEKVLVPVSPVLPKLSDINIVDKVEVTETKPVEFADVKAEEVTPVNTNPVTKKINENLNPNPVIEPVVNTPESVQTDEDDDLFNLLEGLID